MAIITDVPGLEVWVEVDDVRAEEYADPEERSKLMSVHRYIESVPGKTFAVKSSFTPAYKSKRYTLYLNLTIDGTIYAGKFYDRKHLVDGRSRTRSIYERYETLENGKSATRKFQFADLKTSDEEVSSEDVDRYRVELGDLGKLVWTCIPYQKHTIKEEKPPGQEAKPVYSVPDHPEIPFKVMKELSMSHSTELGPAEEYESSPEAKKPSKTRWLRVKGFKGPLPVFTFSYCNKFQLRHFHNCSTTPTTTNAIATIPTQVVTPAFILAVQNEPRSVVDMQPFAGQQDVEEKIILIKKEIETLSSNDHNGDVRMLDHTSTITRSPEEMTVEELENEAKKLRRQELIGQVKQMRARNETRVGGVIKRSFFDLTSGDD